MEQAKPKECYVIKMTYGPSSGSLEGTYSYAINSRLTHHDNLSFLNYYDGYFERYAYKTLDGAQKAILPLKKRNSINIDDYRSMQLAKSKKEKDRIMMKAALKNDTKYEVIPLKQMYMECLDKYPKMNNIDWVKNRMKDFT